ncbi:MAG: hypothetical protein EOP02_18015, partial [Proteobacteria bacterium]
MRPGWSRSFPGRLRRQRFPAFYNGNFRKNHPISPLKTSPRKFRTFQRDFVPPHSYNICQIGPSHADDMARGHRNRTGYMNRSPLFKSAFASTLLLGLGAGQARAAVFQVTNTKDSGAGSLRQAILASNANPDGDTIIFAPQLKTAIKLTSGEISITGKVKIDGPGEGVVPVSGNRASRIFNIGPGGNVNIVDLTIGQGYVTSAPGVEARGGAIFNSGKLSLNRVTLSGNLVRGGAGEDAPSANKTGSNARGGAVFNQGTLSLSLTTFKNNAAIGGQGGDGSGGRGRPIVPGGSGGWALGGGLYNGGILRQTTSTTYSGNSVAAGLRGLYATGTPGSAAGPDLRDAPPTLKQSIFVGPINYPFTKQLEATGDLLTYSVASGTLPPGIGLDPTSGRISGIPTAVVSKQVIYIQVSDGFRSSRPVPITLKFTATPEKKLVVNTIQDSPANAGPQLSLREAIEQANLNPDASVISFDLPSDGPQVVNVSSDLPAINSPVVLQGPGVTIQGLYTTQ